MTRYARRYGQDPNLIPSNSGGGPGLVSGDLVKEIVNGHNKRRVHCYLQLFNPVVYSEPQVSHGKGMMREMRTHCPW